MPNLGPKMLAAALCLLVTPAMQARAASTVETYLANEETEDESGRLANLYYLAAVLDSLTAANRNALAQGYALFCPEDPDVTMSAAALHDFIDDRIAYARRYEDDFERYSRTVTVGTVGLQVMAEVFPCDEAALSAILPPERAADAVIERLFGANPN